MTEQSVTPARPSWRRITVCTVAALIIGLGFAAVSGYVISDFVAAQDDSASDVYLANVPAEEDMLRLLSEQLMQGTASDPSALSEIAPAAGEPLGTIKQ